MLITHIPEEVTNSFIEEMNKYKESFEYDPTNSVSGKALWSRNIVSLLNFKDSQFSKNCTLLKLTAEKVFHCKLLYHYIHFIDYTTGGCMDYHTHEHAEDFVFILYLNDCTDGETNFHLKRVVSLIPKKSQVVFFECDVDHSASFSTSKQVLVGGFKKV
jgi:hypothetical protein